MTKTEKRMSRIVVGFILNSPLSSGTVLLRFRRVPDASVDNFLIVEETLRYNPAYVLATRRRIAIHTLMHEFVSFLDRPRNTTPHMWNIAADAAINQVLRDSPSLDGMTTEEYYDSMGD